MAFANDLLGDEVATATDDSYIASEAIDDRIDDGPCQGKPWGLYSSTITCGPDLHCFSLILSLSLSIQSLATEALSRTCGSLFVGRSKLMDPIHYT